MAIQLNDNLKINAGKPIDTRYLTTGNTAYASISAVNTAIPVPLRYTGLTVNVMGTEYWYASGVSNINLIQKKYDTIIPIGDFITGATNIGFFSGFTGVQTLPLDNLVDNTYDGNYISLYNYYYRGADCRIHIGDSPTDGLFRRGYVKTVVPVKSFLWNEVNDFPRGWILVNGNISQEIGTVQVGVPYYPPSVPYSATSWTQGASCNNGSNLVVNTIVGSLSTGSTITIGGPVFGCTAHNNLHFRTIMTCSPNTLGVTYDEAFVYLSGATALSQGQNVGSGVGVFKIATGGTMQFRSLSGTNGTTIIQSGDTILISGSGGSGGGTYNLSTPSTVTVGGLPAGSQLTGNTAFQLFEKILVPYLSPNFSSFSNNQTTPVEVGTTISGNKTFTWSFSTPANVLPNSMCIIDVTNFNSLLVTNTGTTSPLSVPITSKTFTSCGDSQVWCGSAKNTCSVQFNSGARTVTGLLPYYWGVCTCPGPAGANRPVASCTMVLSGNKVLAGANGSISINFNSGSNDYLWFAIPASNPDKTCWYVTALNNGSIGGGVSPGCNLFPDPDESIPVTTACWSGCNYDVYISNKQTCSTSSMSLS